MRYSKSKIFLKLYQIPGLIVSADQPAAVDASYYARFQIDKRTYDGSSRNWCCIDEPEQNGEYRDTFEWPFICYLIVKAVVQVRFLRCFYSVKL